MQVRAPHQGPPHLQPAWGQMGSRATVPTQQATTPGPVTLSSQLVTGGSRLMIQCALPTSNLIPGEEWQMKAQRGLSDVRSRSSSSSIT